MIINLIGLSGGKDSTALWAWAINESGYPKESIRGTFCDTGNEYDEVYDQIKALDEYGQKHGIAPIITLRANDPKWTWNQLPLFLALAIWKKRFPAARARFCTELLKIIPTKKYIEMLQLDGHEVVLHSGVRASESIERSMLPEWDSGQFGCMVRRPLLKLSLVDVWDMHRKYRVPINKLYTHGWKRVGCRLCCMSNKMDVRRTVLKRPWVIALYAVWEKIVRKPELLSPQRNLEHGSGFFPATTVPAAFRSIKGLIRSRNSARGKKGDMYSACTIEDVAKWSMTLRGGKLKDPSLDTLPLFEEEDFNADDIHAPCQSGYCE